MERGESSALPRTREQNPARGANFSPEDWVGNGALSSSSSNDSRTEDDLFDMEVGSERQQQLRPELWKNLPRKTLQKVFRRILADLPFSRISSFCVVFHPWIDEILSMHYILYSHMHLCMICNPRTGLWESEISSEISGLGLSLAPETEELKSPDDIMQQAFCDKGHLLLSSGVSTEEHFVLFNLLTGGYMRLGSTEITHARRPHFYREEVGSTSSPRPKTIIKTTSRLAYWRVPFPKWDASDYLLVVKLVLYKSSDSVDSSFCITVAKQFKDSKQAICVRDLRSSEKFWHEPQGDFSLLFEPIFLFANTLVLGFSTCPDGYRVLTYDLCLKACAWNCTDDAVRRFPTGTMTANVNADHHEVQFFEVREERRGHMILARSRFPPSTIGQRSHYENGSRAENNNNGTATRSTWEAKPRGNPRESESGRTGRRLQHPKPSEISIIARLEDGDVKHYVGILKRSTSEQLEVSVRTHNRVDRSDYMISEWKEWRALALESGDLWPTARHFCILKPSLKLWPYESLPLEVKHCTV
ncbi:unnamed protein product [Calypogeia fissa]